LGRVRTACHSVAMTRAYSQNDARMTPDGRRKWLNASTAEIIEGMFEATWRLKDGVCRPAAPDTEAEIFSRAAAGC